MDPSLEAGLWVLGVLLARPGTQILWPLIKPKVGEWGGFAEKIGPWLLALGPLYMALLTGAVLGSTVGLYGFGLESSLYGALAGLVVVAGLFGVGRFLANRYPLPMAPAYDAALQDELRWAFFRGAAASWLGEIWLGGVIGWGLAAAEWLLTDQPWKQAAWQEPSQWKGLIRAAVSAGLYMLSRNLWLVLVFQLLAVWVWRLEAAPSAHEVGEDS